MGETMKIVLQDLRYGARMLLKRPGFTLIAVLSLALGIGANSAIFSLIDALLFRPLPVAQPEELVALTTSDHHSVYPHELSYPDFIDFKNQREVFADVTAYLLLPLSVTAMRQSERVWGVMVTGNYFSMLGVRPVVGRLLRPDEDQPPGGHPVAVLSYKTWQRRFGGALDVVGKTLVLNGRDFVVIGVAPPEFKGLNPIITPELWVPLSMHTQLVPGSSDLETARGAHGLRVWARLKPGRNFDAAQAAVNLRAKQLEQEYPETNRDVRVQLYPQWEARFEPGTGRVMAFAAAMLMVVAWLVLLIASANVANLLLTRMTERRREIAVRLALGASRGRLVRQLLTESLLLALLSASVAVPLATWATSLFSSIMPPSDIPFAIDTRMDGRVLGFNLLIALLAVIFFGLVPALQAAKVDLTIALRREAVKLGRWSVWFNFRNGLIMTQVAISLVLLVCAGLFLRSFINAQSADLGLRTKNELLASLDVELNGYDESRGRAFYRQLIERARALPSVRSASMVNYVPLDFSTSTDEVIIEGRDVKPENEKITLFSWVVGLDYFAAIGTPLVRGRDFTPQDDEGHPGVVIVNETMARRFWPNEEALGKRLRLGRRDGPRLEVIGIARDGKYRQYFEDPQPCLFLPWNQRYRGRMTLVLHAAGDASALAAALRREVAMLDLNLPLYDLKTMEAHLGGRLMLGPGLAASLLGACSLIGLLLAAMGTYGIVTYTVTQSTRDIGIRLALGAQTRDVLVLAIWQGIKPVLIGTTIGLAAASGLTRLLQNLLFGVSATDPLTFAGVSLLLLLIALLACYLPARRATKVDPMVALRFD
jgi:macrolide transport system ATP-binding/permease protein